jgi:hypothetical protein
MPALKKPGSKASAEEKSEYKAQQRKRLTSRKALEDLCGLRGYFDAAGAANQDLLAALDGSFFNRIFFGAKLDRIEIVARGRKDAVLCFAEKPGSRRFYSIDTFTPESRHPDPVGK